MTTLDDFKSKELDSLRGRVKRLLKTDAKCRDSNKWLIYTVLQEIAKENGQKIFIPFELFDKFPAYGSITRVKRKLKEEGEVPLGDPEVEKTSRNYEEQVRRWALR